MLNFLYTMYDSINYINSRASENFRFSEIYHSHFGRTGGITHLNYEFIPISKLESYFGVPPI
jgi:hypothetical protein